MVSRPLIFALIGCATLSACMGTAPPPVTDRSENAVMRFSASPLIPLGDG